MMNWKIILVMVVCAALLANCTTTVPYHLAEARVAYLNAMQGRTALLAPAELRVAGVVLAQAEQAFQKSSKSYRTLDLSYVALRKIQLANATASIAIEKENQFRLNTEYAAVLTNKKWNRNLRAADAENDAQGTNDKYAADASVAEVALATSVVVTYDSRGMVIAFFGDVLFAPNQSQMAPEAKKQLNNVADLLLASPRNHIRVEGYLDSREANGATPDLSQRRADAVRDYLILKRYNPKLIVATGMGIVHPANNTDGLNGPADNRRVEIVIERLPEDAGSIPAKN